MIFLISSLLTFGMDYQAQISPWERNDNPAWFAMEGTTVALTSPLMFFARVTPMNVAQNRALKVAKKYGYGRWLHANYEILLNDANRFKQQGVPRHLQAASNARYEELMEKPRRIQATAGRKAFVAEMEMIDWPEVRAKASREQKIARGVFGGFAGLAALRLGARVIEGFQGRAPGATPVLSLAQNLFKDVNASSLSEELQGQEAGE